MLIPVLGDIVQSSYGWFYRANGDGTFDSLSDAGSCPPAKVTIDAIDCPLLLVRDGQPTPEAQGMTARLALHFARRYAAAA